MNTVDDYNNCVVILAERSLRQSLCFGRNGDARVAVVLVMKLCLLLQDGNRRQRMLLLEMFFGGTMTRAQTRFCNLVCLRLTNLNKKRLQ